MFNPSDLTDYELAENIKKDKEANACLLEVINRHTGIYIKIASRFFGNPNVDVAGVIEDKPFNIYQACLSYDKEKGTKFPTYLAQTTEYICLRQAEQNKKAKFEEISENYYAESNVRREVEINEKMETVYEELCKMDMKTQKIFKERFYDSDSIEKPTTWNKISETNNITFFGASWKVLEANKKIKTKLQKL